MGREKRVWWIREWHFDAIVLNFGDAAETVWQACLEADPTTNARYLQWIVRQVLRRNLNADVAAVRDTLAHHDRCKSALPLRSRNIDNFDNFADVAAAVSATSSRLGRRFAHRAELEAFEEDGSLETLFHGPEGKIVLVATHAAMRVVGRGTKWCVAAEDPCWFRDYWADGTGKFIVLMPKGGRKRIVHLPTACFFGADNAPLDFVQVWQDRLFARLFEVEDFQHWIALSQRPFALAYADQISAGAAAIAARRIADAVLPGTASVEPILLADDEELTSRFLAGQHRHFSRLEIAFLLKRFARLFDSESQKAVQSERQVGLNTFTIEAMGRRSGKRAEKEVSFAL
jgi:hypothetical protein